MYMSHLKVGSAADILISISTIDLSLLMTTLVPPSGWEEPAKVAAQWPCRNLLHAQRLGSTWVHLKMYGQHVASSSIPVVISQSEIGDASHVQVSGQGLHEGFTFELVEFTLMMQATDDSVVR